MKNEQEAVKSNVADSDMGLIDSIYARHSVRGYLDKEVPQDVMNRIFEIAQQSPSNCNVQPWKVFVASGALKDRLRRQMVEATSGGVTPNPDYPYRGDFSDEYRTRQVECAVALYSKMGIGRGDKEGRMRAVLRNFEFFRCTAHRISWDARRFWTDCCDRCRDVRTVTHVKYGGVWAT